MTAEGTGERLIRLLTKTHLRFYQNPLDLIHLLQYHLVFALYLWILTQWILTRYYLYYLSLYCLVYYTMH